MLLLLIRLLSRLGCKTDSGSFRANSLETSELVPAEVIALWKIHPQPWKRYPTPTQAGLRSSLLSFNDWYPMSVSCLSGHSLERHYTFLMMVSLQYVDIYTLSTKQEDKTTPLSCQIHSTIIVNVNYWCHRVRDTLVSFVTSCTYVNERHDHLKVDELIKTYNHLFYPRGHQTPYYALSAA